MSKNNAKTKTKDKDKAKDKAKLKAGPARAKVPTAAAVRVLLAGAIVAALAAGLHAQRRRLLSLPPYSRTAAQVRLADVPRWMPDDVAQDVLADIASAASKAGRARTIYDPDLARDVYLQAAGNPWIAKVQRVRTHGDGTVLVQAEFRRPFALVRSVKLPPDRPVVVAADGTVLPLPAHRIKPNTLITIGDVAGRPPAAGNVWDAPDLVDGLRLLALIRDRPYAAQVTTIDVRNHNARISPYEPHLRLYAQLGRGRRTDIRFGRFPSGDDYCVSPERKLEYLDKYCRDHAGRLAGANDFIDLRYDKLHVSVN